MPITAFTLAQINPTVGDIHGNTALIREAYTHAQQHGAALVIFPELAVIGYPPEDLLYTHKLVEDAHHAITELATLTANSAAAMLVGSLHYHDGTLYNAAYLLDAGNIHAIIHKHHLPNNGVFDEQRYFNAGTLPNVVQWRDRQLGIMICEDMWHDDVTAHLAAQGALHLLVLNASPFEHHKHTQRLAWATTHCTRHRLPLTYVNMVGGQDEIVFDGGSFTMDAQGKLTQQLPFFTTHDADYHTSASPSAPRDAHTLTYLAMMTGLRDYVEKNKFSSIVLGLSGGIDSALTAAVAVDALGAHRVHAVMLPSPYTSQLSLDEARITAENLGIRYDIIPIEEGMKASHSMLTSLHDASIPSAIALENIQSRLRAVLLMAISNSTGALLITTGNKSEMAVGYATLYGDMCGAYSVLKDVYKTDVFTLARWRNANVPQGAQGKAGIVIPEATITRPPSAELRDNQTDQDSLPPYDILDAILECLVEQHMDIASIVARGFDEATVRKIARLLYMNEYKRRQAPLGVKLTSMNFGRDRRFPLTNRFQL